MADEPRPATPGRGGYRPGAGRKKKTEQDDAYTLLAKAKAKRESYNAQMAELEYKKAIKEVLPRDVVLDEWQNIIINVRAKLLALPTVISARCVNASKLTIEDEAKKIIHEALEELSRDVDY